MGVPCEWLCLHPRLRSPLLAYYYVVGWLCVLAAILATSDAWVDAWRPLFIALVCIPAYRMFDILRWYADFLLDRRHNHVVSTERNLVFVFANLVETALIAAIWLQASGASATPGSALFDAFALVTQLALPELAEGGWAKIGVVMTEITALTLLLGGVAVLVAEVQEKINSSTGEWRGEAKTGLRKQTDPISDDE